MNPDPIYVMMLTFENELCRILEEKLGKDREESAGLKLKYLEKAKEVIDIRDDLLELLGGAK